MGYNVGSLLLPFHAVVPQAARREPLGLGCIVPILPYNLCVVLKLLDDISHIARTYYKHTHMKGFVLTVQ